MKKTAIMIATAAAIGSAVVPAPAQAYRIGPGLGVGLAIGALAAGAAASSYYYGPYGYYDGYYRPRYYRPYYGPAYYGGWSPAYSYYGGSGLLRGVVRLSAGSLLAPPLASPVSLLVSRRPPLRSKCLGGRTIIQAA